MCTESDSFILSSSMLYWGDEGVPGVPPKVSVANMDGSNAHPLMMTGISLRQPSHLALDTNSQILYVSDTYYYKVRSHTVLSCMFIVLAAVLCCIWLASERILLRVINVCKNSVIQWSSP